MNNYVNLELDTTAPSSPLISIESGAQYSTNNLVNLTIECGDGDTTGYQMIIWGDVDIGENVNIQDIEGNSSWITYSTTQQIRLSTADGSKIIYLKIRDDVHNESSQTSDSIILDTTLPVVTVNSLDVSVISKIAGKNVASFSFTSNSTFNEYKIKVVGASGASHDTGVLILTANGSTNTNGSAGGYLSNDPINVSIYGTDLENADSGDGVKIIKVFIMDEAGNWSV